MSLREGYPKELKMFKFNGLLLATALAIAGSVLPSYAVTDVFSTFRDNGNIATGSPIVTLNVPGGRYVIFAKIGLDQDDSTSLVTVTCNLTAGVDFDQDHIRLAASSSARLDNAAIPFQVVHSFRAGSNNNIILSCNFSTAQSSNLALRFAKITAIRVDGLFCKKPSPAVCP
jgi:hypothetical protein